MDGNAIFTVLNKSSIGSDRTSQILLYVTIYTNYTSWKPVTWLGTSISTMKVQIHYAMKKLKRILQMNIYKLKIGEAPLISTQ